MKSLKSFGNSIENSFSEFDGEIMVKRARIGKEKLKENGELKKAMASKLKELKKVIVKMNNTLRQDY